MSTAVIVLIAGNTPDEPMGWVRLPSARGAATTGMVATGETIRGATGDCILVIPGFDGQLRALSTPTRSVAQARAAASHLFRDSLATDVSGAIFAVGGVGEADSRLAAAMSRSRLSAWIERCAAMRLKPQAIYLDCSLLPVAGENVEVVRLADRTLVSAGERGGFTIDSDLAPAVIGQWLAQLGPAIGLIRLQGWTRETLGPALATPARNIAELHDAEDSAIRLARLAAARPAHAPDFASASSERAKAAASPLAPWALAAGLAIAAGLIQIGITVWDGMRDTTSTETILAAAEAEFREARPEVKRVTNLRAQVTAALNAARRPVANPVVAASPLISDVLELHPDVQLDEVRLDGPGQTIELRLSSLLQPQLDSAVEGLRQAAGRIDVGPMQAIDGRSSISVSMGGA